MPKGIKFMDLNLSVMKICHAFVCLLLCTAFLVSPLSASAAGEYKNVKLPTEISLDIPSHWKILSIENRKNLQAAGTAMTKNAGVEESKGVKTSLLAVNAVPDPVGATIRVSITTRPEFTAAVLLAVTKTDLKDIEKLLLSEFQKLEKSGGPHIVSMTTPSAVMLSGHPALVIPYIRNNLSSSSEHWQVVQYRVPLPDRLVEITLSWRKTDEIIWKPILQHVLASLKI